MFHVDFIRELVFGQSQSTAVVSEKNTCYMSTKRLKSEINRACKLQVVTGLVNHTVSSRIKVLA